MLKILHKGLQISLEIDPDTFTGDTETDAAALDAFEEGMLLGLNAATGYACLADGAIASGKRPLGFLINPGSGKYFENVPAVASERFGITFGPCVVITDQIDTTETFVVGDPLYCGTSAEVGLVTKTQPTNAVIIGYAMSAASLASPELQIAVIGN
jgi:hypothetical protein